MASLICKVCNGLAALNRFFLHGGHDAGPVPSYTSMFIILEVEYRQTKRSSHVLEVRLFRDKSKIYTTCIRKVCGTAFLQRHSFAWQELVALVSQTSP